MPLVSRLVARHTTVHLLQTHFHGELSMRLFNPETMTEIIPGIHDMTGAIELPDDNWFFTTTEIPEGMKLAANENGEPVLIDTTERER